MKRSAFLTAAGTALRKRPRQLAGILSRKAKSSLVPRLPVDVDARYEGRVPADPNVRPEPLQRNTVRLREAVAHRRDAERERAIENAAGRIEFLNETIAFDDGTAVRASGDPVDAQSLHWRLKFWGFEHLQHLYLGYDHPDAVPEDVIDAHREWLSEWTEGYDIAANTGYLREHWMPHSVSLRVLNWCRYDAWLQPFLPEAFQRDIRRFAYKNAAFLSNNVEHGVGGNHLVEDAVALVVAGSYFERDDWLAQGHRILRRAASDQFFDDGGHVERSPMYHLIVTQRYLTSVDLLASTGGGSDVVATTAENAVEFAAAIRPPDGEIPLLNDSALGEALAIDELVRYADACDLAPSTPESEGRRDRPETGYHWLGDAEDCLLAVGGDLAVKHLPAHAHAHPAQVLAWVDGRPVLTDTGVLEYAAGDARRRARSVGSHNTVQVDDTEPVCLGNSFHWFGNVTTTVERADDALSMAYDVDGLGQPSYSHRRCVEEDSDGWTVIDDIAGVDATAVARFHVHPDLTTAVDDDVARIVDETTDEHALTVRLRAGDDLAVERASYYPRYGKRRERDVVIASRRADGRIKTRLERYSNSI